MQKEDRVFRVDLNGVAQELVFGCVLALASAQELGFETQKGAQRAADVDAERGRLAPGLFLPRSITFTGKYGFPN